jgi:hypothetical protein
MKEKRSTVFIVLLSCGVIALAWSREGKHYTAVSWIIFFVIVLICRRHFVRCSKCGQWDYDFNKCKYCPRCGAGLDLKSLQNTPPVISAGQKPLTPNQASLFQEKLRADFRSSFNRSIFFALVFYSSFLFVCWLVSKSGLVRGLDYSARTLFFIFISLVVCSPYFVLGIGLEKLGCPRCGQRTLIGPSRLHRFGIGLSHYCDGCGLPFRGTEPNLLSMSFLVSMYSLIIFLLSVYLIWWVITSLN